MKSFLLIGLGRFGRHIAEKLNELGHEVMAVDKNEDRVNEVIDIVTNAQIGNSTNRDFLISLGIDNYDVCIVTISNDFQSSLETTYLLKDLGARYIVSRAEHDLRTPLTSISGNASTLLSNYDKLDEETRVQIFTDIYNDSQ